MKKNFKLALSSLALLAFGLVACDNQGGTSGPNYSHNNKLVESVELSSEYEECQIGDSFQLTATITYKDQQEVEVYKEWISSKTSVAKLTVDESSDSAIVEVVGSGTTYITFRAGLKMAKCKIYVASVTPDPGPGPEPGPDPDPETDTSITLSVTSRTLDIGGEFTLTATVAPVADATFTASDSSIIQVLGVSGTLAKVTALAEGEADVVVTAGDATARCHVTVLGEEQGDKDYTIYFYIDFNNTNAKTDDLVLKFDWYYDRPFSEYAQISALQNVKDGQAFDPNLPNYKADGDAKDPAFPYFIGWSTHSIIDSKKDLWDLSKNTVADLPMMSYTVTLYGQWMDAAVLPAQEDR